MKLQTQSLRSRIRRVEAPPATPEISGAKQGRPQRPSSPFSEDRFERVSDNLNVIAQHMEAAKAQTSLDPALSGGNETAGRVLALESGVEGRRHLEAVNEPYLYYLGNPAQEQLMAANASSIQQ